MIRLLILFDLLGLLSQLYLPALPGFHVHLFLGALFLL
jgi:hypothetical protein